MKQSESIDKIIPAFIAFQSDMPAVPKDSENPAFTRGDKKSKYASLGGITEAMRPHLKANGLGVTQYMGYRDGVQLMFTRIMHTSGQWMEDDGYLINPTRNDPQGMGSAVTYGRRYTLGASLGIITEDDDDGNKASEPVKPTPAVQPTPAKPAVKELKEPDWFTENGELNENGIKAAHSIIDMTFPWSKIEKHYLIDKGTKKAINDYIETIK
jgi:hypothetical protein